jgi:hypothetical protein
MSNQLEKFHDDLYRELHKLLRPAVEQAKKGKPALLRLLLRSIPRPQWEKDEDRPTTIILDAPRPNRD